MKLLNALSLNGNRLRCENGLTVKSYYKRGE